MSMWLERLTKPSPTNAPPTRREIRRNDLLVAGVALFALFLAFGVRNQVLNASASVRVVDEMPRIAYPAGWRSVNSEGTLLHVVNAGSPSTFDAQMTTTARPLRTDETLDDARADRGIKLATSLAGYRELAAERMTVHNGQPALVTNYAYIADPTRDIGAIGLPVVVEAQDIMFLQDGQFMVVTLAADANDWDAEQDGFAIITNSLRLQPLADSGPAASLAVPTPGPTATPDVNLDGARESTEPLPAAPAEDTGFGETQAGTGDTTGDGQSEGGN
jgi:hypothetical protein